MKKPAHQESNQERAGEPLKENQIMKLTDSIKPDAGGSGQTASDENTNAQTMQRAKPVSSAIPDYFQRAKVFGVLPVDDSNGELRTGISFKLESGEIVWLNLSCSDAEWMCVTLRSWMSDYESGKQAERATRATTDA